jgi:hypothetical protein
LPCHFPSVFFSSTATASERANYIAKQANPSRVPFNANAPDVTRPQRQTIIIPLSCSLLPLPLLFSSSIYPFVFSQQQQQ